MIAILTSGVALGVHVPGLLLRERLAERGVPARVYVLEAFWEQADRDRLARSREAFQKDFRVALATQRLRRRHDELITAGQRRRLHAAWAADGVDHFVIFSGFWLPIVEEYGGTAETCHLDAVDSPSFTPYAPPARAVRLMDHEAGLLRWTIPVTSQPPVPWSERDRLLVHGGGWSLGTYREHLGALRAAGHRVDVVVGAADHDPDGPADERVRRFRLDPGWNAWDDPGFPPLIPTGPGADEVLKAGWDPRGDGKAHPSFALTRRARATVSKPGGGSLMDGLAAATPAVLLDSFGAHEDRNAELWIRLGLGVPMAAWQESGYSGELLRGLHERALELRERVPDYAADLARRIDERSRG